MRCALTLQFTGELRSLNERAWAGENGAFLAAVYLCVSFCDNR